MNREKMEMRDNLFEILMEHYGDFMETMKSANVAAYNDYVAQLNNIIVADLGNMHKYRNRNDLGRTIIDKCKNFTEMYRRSVFEPQPIQMPQKQRSKADVIAKRYEDKQREFETMINRPPPAPINFADPIEDDAPNIDELLQRQLQQRELEYNSIANMRPPPVTEDRNPYPIKIHDEEPDVDFMSPRMTVSFSDRVEDATPIANSFLKKLKNQPSAPIEPPRSIEARLTAIEDKLLAIDDIKTQLLEMREIIKDIQAHITEDREPQKVES